MEKRLIYNLPYDVIEYFEKNQKVFKKIKDEEYELLPSEQDINKTIWEHVYLGKKINENEYNEIIKLFKSTK